MRRTHVGAPDLPSFLDVLERNGELHRVTCEVDPELLENYENLKNHIMKKRGPFHEKYKELFIAVASAGSKRAAFAAANADRAERIRWHSESNPGVEGYAEPAGPAQIENGNLCKDIRSAYVFEGEEKSVTDRFCFRNGRWKNG